ncbi:hypothetical protein QR680_004619 [Steinernema hermaphroditum]|uniref:Uncharacterized protein n=1 Tax=Steinernema hermaphroditum TaxID=289476 RepID=A0AA39HQB8_9BILA|nr:hypothetical protein QR680_004619 [Steinernema hermaphroditum]
MEGQEFQEEEGLPGLRNDSRSSTGLRGRRAALGGAAEEDAAIVAAHRAPEEFFEGCKKYSWSNGGPPEPTKGLLDIDARILLENGRSSESPKKLRN